MEVLCVGMVCEDVILEVDSFPKEDSDLRTRSLRRTRGGNANNTATVLVTLGIKAELLASLSLDDCDFITRGLAKDNVAQDKCPRHPGQVSPNSVIIASRSSGSRTILHTNLGLPELTFDDFDARRYSSYKWVHFEGRPNVSNLAQMAKSLFDQRKGQIEYPRISLEMEKCSRQFHQALPYVDLVFVSKEYSMSKGFQTKVEAASGLHRCLNLRQDTMLICAWGEDGAAAKDVDGHVYESQAFPPESGAVVDTLGAGDTFNSAIIASFLRGCTMEQAIVSGCKVAGKKVGQLGYHGLSL